MKRITKKIKFKLFRVGCRHDFKRFAFYHVANKGIYSCTKCDKRKEVYY